MYKLFYRMSTLTMLLVFIFMTLTVQGSTGMRLKDKFRMTSTQESVYYEAIKPDQYYWRAKETYAMNGYKPSGTSDIVINARNINASDSGDIPIHTSIGGKVDGVLAWKEECQWFEWTFDIPEDGLYEMAIEYYPLPGSGGSVQRGLTIDGKFPFVEAQNIVLPRIWRDMGEPKVNNIGDEVRPRQVEVLEWRIESITDNQGKYSGPFQFYLARGTHVLRMQYIDQPVVIGGIILKSPEAPPPYEEIKKQYAQKGYKPSMTPVKIFQAENTATAKTDPTIRRESDSDPATEPPSGTSRRLNVIGGWRWRYGNQSITWEFEVPEDGLYKIGLKVGQWWGDGMPVYRQIMINGKVPFAEMAEYAFGFDRNWRLETLGDPLSGEQYLFYLPKGRNQLTMTVKMGPFAAVVQGLNDSALLISDVTRRIMMVTGQVPDPNYEYQLEKNIPGLMDDLRQLSDRMQHMHDILISISAKQSSSANTFMMLKQQLDKLISDPELIPKNLEDLNNAQINLGAYITSLPQFPLAIDYFLFGAPDENWQDKKSNIFQRIWVSLQNLRLSFVKNYDNVGGVEEIGRDENIDKVIHAWVARGREWAEILKEMADDDFTPQTGIAVNINVIPAGQVAAGNINALMLSIISGKAPDIALGVDPKSPVEYAIRDAVLDLSGFDDYMEISRKFLPGVMVPFAFREGVYALPETMNFNVLFYRKDIFSEIDVPIPGTWKELYENVLPVLYQHRLEFGYDGGLLPFLYQHGGSYYNQDGSRSGLDSPEAYRAFKEWCDLYLAYGIPVNANIFNHFRTGIMPMAAGSYDLYVQLSVAAPELFGRWGVALMPGQQKEDGTVDRTVGGGIAGTAGIILKQSKQQEEAWEFLKWYTSAQTQMRFGRELEALMGVQARWNTANIEAFNGLPWKIDDLRVIQESWQWYKEQPVVLGGYFTDRHVANAFTRVIMTGMNIRDSLEKSVKDINVELRSKQEEYGRLPVEE